ncbi:sodium:alanine symporter family protein [Candidatus Dependentiae bacterium]|nr:MAG: sodium:alanine symporter family protein [Candidatus Dependentiae bacterium]
MNIIENIGWIAAILAGWPLMIYVSIVCVLCTLLLRGIQFRHLSTGIRLIFSPTKKSDVGCAGDMTPIQAFVNTLSTNLGNGTIAGMATAIYAGGPGAAIWFIICSFLLMSVRYAEVFVSALYGNKAVSASIGGPMLYLKSMPFGGSLAYIYAILCFFYGIIGGGAIQANSISLSLQTACNVPSILTAILMGTFVLYVGFGGAHRIVKLSNYLVPVKVGLFFGSAFIILAYYITGIPAALHLMFLSAIDPAAANAALMGITLQQAIQYGLMRSVFASESGLGTAAILFGSTGTVRPAESALMGMMSTFVSAIVCFILALCITVTGMWSSGLTSTALTVATFNTTFGSLGGVIVSILSIIFGLGVTVAYAYIVRACWLVIVPSKYEYGNVLLYALVSAVGAIGQVAVVWQLADIVQALMLFVNLAALLMFVCTLRTQMIDETDQLSQA